MAAALVVVGEAAVAAAPISYSPAATATVSGPSATGSTASGLVDQLGLVAVDHLQQLQHRLVVLELVREQHLVDEAFAQQRFLRVGARYRPSSSTSSVRSRTSAM